MRKLHTANHAPEAHLIRSYLEAQGISASVRGEHLIGGIGELPVDVCSVWIVEGRDFDRADALVREYLRGDAERLHRNEGWLCPGCREDIEGQFTDCWRCGVARPET